MIILIFDKSSVKNIVTNLIIRAELSNPPSETLAFRSLTMMSRQIELDNLIEIDQIYKDIYYNYMKFRGLLDFVDQLITPPENENGIRIDMHINYPFTIKTDRIVFTNVLNLLGQISYLKNY
jgi:hypothetical protein